MYVHSSGRPHRSVGDGGGVGIEGDVPRTGCRMERYEDG